MVQCCGIGKEEGWRPTVLHQLPPFKLMHEKGLLPSNPEYKRHWESLVGAGHFSCLDLKSGFWQIKMDKASEQYTTFTVGCLGF